MSDIHSSSSSNGYVCGECQKHKEQIDRLNVVLSLLDKDRNIWASVAKTWCLTAIRDTGGDYSDEKLDEAIQKTYEETRKNVQH